MSSPEVISVLKNDYINCWLLAKDLDEISQQSADPEIAKLCELIRENYKYPVDSVLISDKLEVLGHANVNQFEILFPDGYRRFLEKGLLAAGLVPSSEPQETGDSKSKSQEMKDTVPEVAAPDTPRAPAGLVLTRDRPEDSLLEIAQHAGNGQPGFAMYSIDVSDFGDGGTIEVKVRVGGGDAQVECELCSPAEDSPGFFLTCQSMPSVKPGETKTMSYKFEKGVKLSLVVKALPTPDAPAQASPFLATVSVK